MSFAKSGLLRSNATLVDTNGKADSENNKNLLFRFPENSLSENPNDGSFRRVMTTPILSDQHRGSDSKTLENFLYEFSEDKDDEDEWFVASVRLKTENRREKINEHHLHPQIRQEDTWDDDFLINEDDVEIIIPTIITDAQIDVSKDGDCLRRFAWHIEGAHFRLFAFCLLIQ